MSSGGCNRGLKINVEKKMRGWLGTSESINDQYMTKAYRDKSYSNHIITLKIGDESVFHTVRWLQK
jgi:cysteine sulfinate desulfinase/cysteine desulfurase-like protein